MGQDTTQQQIRQVAESLLDSLDDRKWLKLPFTVMQDVGPAVQTLAGILAESDTETFVRAATIARQARLPVATVKKHLATLHAHGWIDNRGRQRTRGGVLRRTATIRVTEKTRQAIKPYGILPCWAGELGDRLPWSAKAILSVVMARLCSLKAAIEADERLAGNDFFAALEDLGGDERFRFSLDYLERTTGLARNSVIMAKRSLSRLGIINWAGMTPAAGVETGTDALSPNLDLQIRVAPTEPPYVYIDRS